ncbi:MAG: MGMT family protein [Putridiphycobacter sp.]|nr:MGMT family protein [Putridiphycobacter sp.]
MQADFYQNIFDVVKEIPFGKVTSYGAIAKYLGAAKSSRLVGWAMNASHAQPAEIPAHRVVNRNGLLTGKMHFSSPTKMQELLEAEGIVVINDQIQNFKSVYWDPELELGKL